MKIHLCCGDVYLKGYINVDAVGELVSGDNPNETTLENYYTGKVHENKRNIVDRIMKLPEELDSCNIEEYLMISAFEHFSLVDAEILVDKIYRSLVNDGVFRFDFPDIEMTIWKYSNQPEYMMRLIYGSGKNGFGFHKNGYTIETIKNLLGKYPWSSIVVGKIVKHEYPMIGITATK
jgi:hypothetical protein